MSLVGHIHAAADEPVDAERMMRAVATGSSRSWRRWRGEGAAMLCVDGATLATGPGMRTAIVDGHIHNRAELVAYAGCDPAVDDARLILAVHARAGDATPDHVIGDYSFALWEGERRRLLAAVDPGGYWPLVLAESDGGLIFASEARALFAHGSLDRMLDETRVAEWLALLGPDDPSRTLFAGVRRVPPGSRAIWTPTGLTIERWWRPEARPMLQLRRHQDYVDAVQATLEQAVACRLAGDDRIGSHLSGGLDSGIVTAMAARQLGRSGRRLTAFTAAPANTFRDEPGRFGDEWPHAAAIAATHPAIDHFRIANDALSVAEVQMLREAAQDVPLLNLQNSQWISAIDREAAAQGVTVMLTGSAGNMSFSYDGFPLLGRLLRRRPLHGVHALLLAKHVQRLSWRRVAGLAANEVLPETWMHMLRRVSGRRGVVPTDYSLIDPAFAARHGCVGRWATQTVPVGAIDRDDSRALRLAVLERFSVQGEFAAATRRIHGIDTRDPTADRRLLELCLQIPDDHFLRRGLPRAIARKIGLNLLPAAVATELRRGRQSADWAHGIEAALPDITADLTSLRSGRSVPHWVDLDRIEHAIGRWPGAEHATDADAVEWTAITRALSASRFIRRVEGSNA